MPYPRFQRARAFVVRTRKTTGGGDISVTSTTWAAVSTTLDITLDAQSGDVLEAGVSALWGPEANLARLDVGTVIATGIGSAFGGLYSTTSLGVPAWRAPGGSEVAVSGSVWLPVSAIDVVEGFVTCRLLARVDAGTPIRILNATDSVPLQFWVKNHGPQDPSALL